MRRRVSDETPDMARVRKAADVSNIQEWIERLPLGYNTKIGADVHRLCTVRNADNIIVLYNGRIAEEGTHEQLTARREKYHELVRNQLELGN